MRFLAFLFAVLALPASAQHDGSHDHAASPYADDTDRAVKALSAEEAEGLLAGRGLGFARAAELNGYPGPLHVLELADDLGLTDEQRANTQRLFDAMQAEAQTLGQQIVQMETRLDALFAEGEATSPDLVRITGHIGSVRGALRAVHLRAHLDMMAILAPEQIAAYQQLRGYTD